MVKEAQGDRETAEILFGLGQAQAGLARTEQAVGNLTRAFDYYIGVNDTARAIVVADFPLDTYIPGVGELLDRALGLLPPDSHQAGRLLPRYIQWLATEGDYEGAVKGFDLALAIARQEEDSALETQTLTYGTANDVWHLHLQEALEKGRQAIDLARRIDAPRDEENARFWVAIALNMMGDHSEAQGQAELVLPAAERAHSRYFHFMGLWVNLLLAISIGDWQAARSFGKQDFGLASEIEDIILSLMALMEFQLGEFSQGQDYLDRFEQSRTHHEPEEFTIAVPLIARITGTIARFEFAEAVAHRALANPNPLFGSKARTGLALMAVQRGDVLNAEQYYRALQPNKGRQG